MAGPRIDLAAPVLRSAAAEVLGFVIYHAPLDVRREAYLRLTGHAARGTSASTSTLPLAQVRTAWRRKQEGAGAKLVLTV